MARLTDKIQETASVITSNPQTAGLAGEIRPFAGDTSGWPVVNGVRQLKGWAVCEGDVLEQANYPDLFANIGSTWDTFNHPNDGLPTVGGTQFALPNLSGLHLKCAGNNGNSTAACGDFQDQGTVKNNLNTTSSDISGTTNPHDHSHTRGTMNITGSVRASGDDNPISIFSDPVGAFGRTGTTTSETQKLIGDGIQERHTLTFNAASAWTGSTNEITHDHTVTGTADAQDLTSTDEETRPTSVAVSYIIALYNNVANVITTNDLTVSNVTVTGDLTTDTANATTVSANTANVTTVSADNVSATTYSGLPEATTSTSGVVKKNKWQRRVLENTINNAGDTTQQATDLKFSNLEIGKFYKLTIQARFRIVTTNSNINLELSAFHTPGGENGPFNAIIIMLETDLNTAVGDRSRNASAVFQAVDPEIAILFTSSTTNGVADGWLSGGSVNDTYDTFVILEELDNYEGTTDFTPTP